MAAPGIECVPVLDHLLEPESDDGRLSVVAHLEAVTEPGCARHNVLQGAADLDNVRVLDNCYPEAELLTLSFLFSLST